MKLKKCLIGLLCLGALGTTTQTVFAANNSNERAAVNYSFHFSTSEATNNVTKQSKSTYGNVRLESVNAGGKVMMKVRNSSNSAISNSTGSMSVGSKYAMTYTGNNGSSYWGHNVHGYLEGAASSTSTIAGKVFWAPDAW